jgi:glycosyltransferase involved in cell wall biosynthesis
VTSSQRPPQRILHVVNRLGDRGDGISNVCVDLACQQSIDGDEVAVATIEGGYTELVRRFGVRVELTDFRVRNPFAAVRVAVQLRRIIADFRPSIVHAHTLVATVIARAAVMGSGSLVVSTVHNEYQRGVILMAFAHRVVGVSAAVTTSMARRRIPARRLRTVLNGVVGSVRRPAGQPQTAQLATPAIVTVGAVSHRKGADILVQAGAELAKSHGAHTYFAGNIDWEEPAKLVAANGVADNIHFLGFQSDPRPLLQAATVFVLASRRDPAPLVLTEAMEAGLPIVATAVDGVPELLGDDRAGILVPADDLTLLVEHVRRLLDDEAERNQLARAARERAAQLSVTRMTDDYREVYAELLEKGSVTRRPHILGDSIR